MEEEDQMSRSMFVGGNKNMEIDFDYKKEKPMFDNFISKPTKSMSASKEEKQMQQLQKEIKEY